MTNRRKKLLATLILLALLVGVGILTIYSKATI